MNIHADNGNQSTDPLGHLTPLMVGQLTPPIPGSQCSPIAPDDGQLTPDQISLQFSRLHLSSSEKVRNGPDYFGGMGGEVLRCYGYWKAKYG